MKTYPGKLEEHIVYHEKFPEEEYDPLGIPYGIQIDYDRPFLDSLGNKRSVIVYRPSTLAPFLLAKSMIVLCDETNISDIADVMNDSGLVYLSEHDKAFLVFVLPSELGWNSNTDSQKPNDEDLIVHVMQALREGFLFPGREQCIGYYMGMIGVGTGAELAHISSAQHPEFTSCLLTFDGTGSSDLQSNGCQDALKFVWLVNPQGKAEEYWIKVNGLESVDPFSFGDTLVRCDPVNPARQVRVTKNDTQGVNAGIINRFWDYVFKQIVRIPGIGHGDVVDCAHIVKEYHPCIHKMDRLLGDNQGISHNWLEFIPEFVREHRFQKEYSCPLVIVMHGGGCTPDLEIAVFNTHELGEFEGFITVYPNASAKNSWNSTLLKERYSDVDFIAALIEYMKHHYPIDPTRVLLKWIFKRQRDGTCHCGCEARIDCRNHCIQHAISD